MSFESLTEPSHEYDEPRPLPRSMMRGFFGRCSSCGLMRLFTSGLQVEEKCHTCSEELHHHRADDFPAYLNIFITGHVVVALAIILMGWKLVSMWWVVGLSCAAALIMAVMLMRPLKGVVVGAQWALRMHGFGGDDE